MAIVDTIPTLTLVRQPFERPPQEQTLWGFIPRGFLHFSLENGTLDEKPVNDQQHLRISGVLPAGFAYQFVQVGMTITQDRAVDWTNRSVMRLVNWTPGAPHGAHMTFGLEFANEFGDAAAVTPVRVVRGMGESRTIIGQQILFQPGRDAISFSMLAVNEIATVAAAGTVDFIASFLEFDLSQAVRFGLQSPVPVRTR